MKAIDMHAHVLVPELEALVEGHPLRAAELTQQAREMGHASVAQHLSLMPTYLPKLTDLGVRLRDMNASDIAMQALSISPTQYYYWADPVLGAKIVATANQHLGALARACPDRFVALGTVCLQHPELAVAQLSDAIHQHGLVGVEISTRAGELELSDPALEPFFARAAELSALIFVHPLGCTLSERLSSHYLSNVIGQPLETTIALSKLIFSGVFDRHPQLKLCAAHGGGYLPFYIGRSDHAYLVRPECRTTLHKPSEYLRAVYYDSLVYSPLALRHLIDQVGAQRVVLGTDYPFDMGVQSPLAMLHDVPSLTEREHAQIAGGNAAQILGCGGRA